MRAFIATTYLLAGLLSAALLSACAGGPTASTPQLSSLDIQSELKTQPAGANGFGNWMYSAQLYGHDVQIYERNGNSITFFNQYNGFAGPLGTAATPNGWWYITESGNADVVIYKSKKSGPVGPFPPLVDYGQVPVNVAALPNRRLVAVSNQSTVGGGSGSVSIYLNRQTDPSRNLTYGSGTISGMGVAITHQGDCYWSFNGASSGSGAIVKFAGCNGSGTLVASGIAKVGGIIFDQSDNLYYIDETYGIYQCQKTSNCKQFVTVNGWLPINMNFDHKSKDIWVADATGYIVEITSPNNPKKRLIIRTPSEGGASDPPFGVAPAPGQ
jgi:hypothetical protein